MDEVDSMVDELGELFDNHGPVDELDFDLAFQEHLAERGTYDKHIVSLQEVLEVHLNRPRYYMNASARRAPIIMVGPTVAGRMLVIPIEPTSTYGIWRPVTAFEANAHHRERYGRQ